MAVDDEGNPMYDIYGNYIIDGYTVLYEIDKNIPNTFTVYLPYELENNGSFYMYEPELVSEWDNTGIVTMNECDETAIQPWTPYYAVVTDVPVNLGVNHEVTINPEPENSARVIDAKYTMWGTRNPVSFENRAFVLDDFNFGDVFNLATRPLYAWECYFTAPDYIDHIEINREVRLEDDLDNAGIIEDYDGHTVKATLHGRTLYRDGTWNTLCLPFDVSSTGNPILDDALIYEISNSTLAADGTITIDLSRQGHIEAGKPYLVKWESGENIVNPSFNGVTIEDDTPDVLHLGPISMAGNYKPLQLHSDYPVLYLGANNQLCHVTEDMDINSFRAIFFYNPEAIPNFMGAVKLNVIDDNVVTSVDEVPATRPADNKWYSIDGRVFNKKPTTPGIYINNGKKIIIN